MRKTFDKLVRDGIPARLDAMGIRHGTRTARPDELEGLLLAKLQEEVAELLAATTEDDILGEIADVSEVLVALAERYGADTAEMRARQGAKHQDRGGFERGIVLLWTETE